MARNSLTVTINGKEFVSKEAKKSKDSLDKLKKAGELANRALTASFVAAAAGIAAATAAIIKSVNSTQKLADNIDKMSQKIGISRDAFQEWDFILSQNGMNISQLQTSIKTLAGAAEEASRGTITYSRSFDALGVSIYDSNGAVKDQESLLFDTISALGEVENSTLRTAYASDLFGRSATELAPLLNSGADSIEALRAKAHDLGLVLNDETIDAGVALHDTIDQLKRVFQTVVATAVTPFMESIQNLGARLIESLQPGGGLNKFINALIRTITWSMNNIPKFSATIIFAFNVIGIVARHIADELSDFWETTKGVFTKAETFASDIVTALVDGFNNTIDDIKTIGINIWGWIKSGFGDFKEFGVDIITGISDGILSLPTMMETLGSTVWGWIKSGFGNFIDFGGDVIDGIVQGFEEAKNKVTEWWQNLWEIEIKWNIFKSKSPSEEAEKLGSDIIWGMINGLKDGQLKTDLLNAYEEYMQAMRDINAENADDILAGIFGDSGDTSNEEKEAVSAKPGGVTFGGEKSGGATRSVIGDFVRGFGDLIGSLDTFKSIIDPLNTILSGMFDVLQPAIDTILTPVMNVMKIFGETLGTFLLPVFEAIGKVVMKLAEGFMWFYNKVIKPVGDFLYTAFAKIGNGLITLVNGIIHALNWIPGVNINKIGKIDESKSGIDSITMNDMYAGNNITANAGKYAGSAPGSSTSVQSINITVMQYFQGSVIGDGGIEQVGEYMVKAIQAYSGAGGNVQVLTA